MKQTAKSKHSHKRSNSSNLDAIKESKENIIFLNQKDSFNVLAYVQKSVENCQYHQIVENLNIEEKKSTPQNKDKLQSYTTYLEVPTDLKGGKFKSERPTMDSHNSSIQGFRKSIRHENAPSKTFQSDDYQLLSHLKSHFLGKREGLPKRLESHREKPFINVSENPLSRFQPNLKGNHESFGIIDSKNGLKLLNEKQKKPKMRKLRNRGSCYKPLALEINCDYEVNQKETEIKY